MHEYVIPGPWVLPGELWLPVPGYECRNAASDFGRTCSLDRTLRSKDGREWPQEGRLLANSPNLDGYLDSGIPLHLGSRRSGRWYVHQVVMLAFVGPCPDGMEVRHLNGDPGDCRLSNLAYGTGVDNESDKRRHGTHHHTRKVTCKFGHRLVLPNLLVSQLPHRVCRACARARPVVRKHRLAGHQVSHQAVSDQKYAELMAEEAA